MSCERRSGREDFQQRLLEANPGWDVLEAGIAPDGDADLETDFSTFVVPDCPYCGGLLKPDVVFFGENVPRERVAAVHDHLQQADAVLVVGSSLMVYSGFRFVQAAAKAGLPVAALNRGRTRADDLLLFRMSGTALKRWPRGLRAEPSTGSALQGARASVEPGARSAAAGHAKQRSIQMVDPRAAQRCNTHPYVVHHRLEPAVLADFVRPLTLSNRIVIAPMCQYSAEDGRASDWHAMHLGNLAQSGAGLLILEATAVEPRGRISWADLGLWDDGTEAALAQVLASVRRWSPMPLGIQLGHAGRKASVKRPGTAAASCRPMMRVAGPRWRRRRCRSMPPIRHRRNWTRPASPR